MKISEVKNITPVELNHLIRQVDGIIKLMESQELSMNLKSLKKAAEQGYIIAQKKLGDIYEKGVIVEQNYANAMRWYLEAMKQGDVESQNKLKDLSLSTRIEIC